MNNSLQNYMPKNIREFTLTDTIYLNKMNGGHQITYLCEFIAFSKGNVKGKVISTDPAWGAHKNEIKRGLYISCRLKKCYLFGNSGSHGLNYPHCNWFNKEGFAN